MYANIEAVRNGADAISRVELTLSGILYNLSFSAEYGHGSVNAAIDSIHASRRHADRAVVAAAAGNPLMAAKHEAQAAEAHADAVHMLQRAHDHAEDLLGGLETATENAAGALGHAQSLVKLDDSSPAAEIHAKVAGQPEEMRAMKERLQEIRRRIPGSRDPAELRVAAEHFMALRQELEEGSGRAQEIAADALGYGQAV
jgi:hypothetical protein